MLESENGMIKTIKHFLTCLPRYNEIMKYTRFKANAIRGDYGFARFNDINFAAFRHAASKMTKTSFNEFNFSAFSYSSLKFPEWFYFFFVLLLVLLCFKSQTNHKPKKNLPIGWFHFNQCQCLCKRDLSLKVLLLLNIGWISEYLNSLNFNL